MTTEKMSPKLRRLLESAHENISDFSIGFVKMLDQPEPDAEIAGSGTLVKVNDVHAILTADHVIEHLPRSGEVGLVCPSRISTRLHRVILQMELVTRVRVARGATPSKGPDLGLLILPREIVATLNAILSFYNLEKRRERMLTDPPGIEDGGWILVGMVHEWTRDVAPEKGYQRVKRFRSLSGGGIVTKEFTEGEFDYLNFQAKYDEAYDGPQSYEGFSGGGLWQVFAEDEGDEFRLSEYFLSGVPFHQSEIEGIQRTIECHGRKSIYQAVIDTMKSQASASNLYTN